MLLDAFPILGEHIHLPTRDMDNIKTPKTTDKPITHTAAKQSYCVNQHLHDRSQEIQLKPKKNRQK